MDAILIGAAAVDMVVTVDSHPRKDEIALARSYNVFAGGSVANVAVGLARLGLKVGFIGKIADDEFGKLLIDEFKKEGVDLTNLIVVKGGRTAATFIAVDSKGDRVIYALGGDALIENPSELKTDYLAKTKLLYIGEAFPEVALTAIKLARRGGAKVVYSPGGIFSSFGLSYLKNIVKESDIMILSRREIELLTEGKGFVEAAKLLISLGPRAVIVTLGERGSAVIENGTVEMIPAFKAEKVVDTTGAGDAFTVGLLYGTLRGWDLKRAALLGNRVAIEKIRHLGPRSGLPSRNELQRILFELFGGEGDF
jgi:sugar/nucleoside kinase (ribokinase family)